MSKDLKEGKKKKKYPNRARKGEENPMYKHGGWVKTEYLTEEDTTWIESEKKRYLDAYSYLKEPVMMDLLHEYLLIKLRLRYINAYVHNPVIPEEDKLGAEKRADMLRRTFSLLATRMGISYVSRQRRKEKLKRKLPMELFGEDENEE